VTSEQDPKVQGPETRVNNRALWKREFILQFEDRRWIRRIYEVDLNARTYRLVREERSDPPPITSYKSSFGPHQTLPPTFQKWREWRSEIEDQFHDDDIYPV
jgi:hypothetical protein